MGNYRDLSGKLNEKETNRILIMDNNNLEFCTQHKDIFLVDEVFRNYDIILIPEWVHREISHSERRLEYLARIPVPYFIINEEEDYVEFVEYQEFRLMELFKHASSSISPARKYFSGLKKYYNQNVDLPEQWIDDFYEEGFEVKDGSDLRKNAGETSILVLVYLLLHHYPSSIKNITIFSSDKGTMTIKEKIMDNLHKIELIHNPATPISFMSTDILLIEAVSKGWADIEDIERLRPNSKRVIYSMKLENQSSSRHEYVMETGDFIKALKNIEQYHFEF
ncbi:hypothetical protein FZC78_10735 [Rossellomorea vietnamensis]|uniref:Uncharacterized protein n=1 Tax=Rossellomorea vietnamensis TaxID=218284 RepID=A0A5D4NUS7_9BACI|nr:hypothetical protein [Rossellomorea vietnamensis]TYS17086.1 hypothetical protein FZC78_10735 [Rossellomorea vietnamensis]